MLLWWSDLAIENALLGWKTGEKLGKEWSDSDNELDLTFRVPNYGAKFHQNRARIATVGGQGGQTRQTDVTNVNLWSVPCYAMLLLIIKVKLNSRCLNKQCLFTLNRIQLLADNLFCNVRCHFDIRWKKLISVSCHNANTCEQTTLDIVMINCKPKTSSNVIFHTATWHICLIQEAQLLLRDRMTFVSYVKKYFRLWPI